MAIVDLWIEQYPTLLSFVPVFGHPMVEVFAFFEIGAEAAAGARRNALRAQHRHMKKREVPADTDLPLVELALQRAAARRALRCHPKSSRQREHATELAGRGRASPRRRRNVLMDQQTLHSLRKRAGVARQAVE